MRQLMCLLFLFVAMLCPAHEADTIPSSLSLQEVSGARQHGVRFLRSGVCVGVPLVAGSLAFRPIKTDFRALRNEVGFRNTASWEDYLQYAPLAVCYGMKVGGVQSRSAWGRMLVSHAVAAGGMFALTQGLKRAVHETRPNGGDNKSFPSGHTATAFMAATLLHHEYGHLSPWVSVGGYLVATATGVGRIVHNRHWVSDVLCGAGFGILTGELGYYVGDLIFRDRYMCRFPHEENYDLMHRPSFLALRVGASFPLNSHYRPGSDATLEGAYFLTTHWGVGAMARLTSNELSALSVPKAPKALSVLADAAADNPALFSQAYTLNSYYSHPFTPLFRVQGKAGAGYGHTSLHPSATDVSCLGEAQARSAAAFCLGASAHLTPSRRFDASLYLDWSLLTASALDSRPLHTLHLGFATAVRF